MVNEVANGMIKRIKFLRTNRHGKQYIQRHKVDMGGFTARYEELK